MAFRDDVEAANARAEAAEARARELQCRNEQLEARLELAWKARRQPSGRTAIWTTLAGACALAAWLVGPRLLVVVPVTLFFLALAPVWLRTSAGLREVLVLAGGQHRAADGSELGYRLVPPGETTTRVPFVEHVERLDLAEIPCDLEVDGAYASGGGVFRLRGAATVAIALDSPAIHRAVERFLGRPRAEIAQVARQTLEGALRSVLAGIDPLETPAAAEAVARKTSQSSEEDLTKIGLVLRTLEIERIERVERVE